MSTIEYESWAVDLAEVTAIYPFQGAEKFMVALGIAFWLGWHIMQMRSESRELEAAKQSGVDPTAAIDRY